MLTLETKRLQLQELKESDAPTIQKILGDEETMLYYPSPFSLNSTVSLIKRNIASYKKNGFGLWGVVLKQSNQLIGQCGIIYQDIDGALLPEIGYHINKEFWNQGYATEAALAVMDYGLQTFKFEELFIHTSIKNIPSQRVAEKIGMTQLKIYDKYIASHNITWKHVVYSISKDVATR